MYVEAPGFPPKIPRLWGKVNVVRNDGMYLQKLNKYVEHKFLSSISTSQTMDTTGKPLQ